MYKVVVNQEDFYKIDKYIAAMKNKDVYNRVLSLTQCLNQYYGAERDLEKDLGGYIVLVYGDSKDIKSTVKNILAYHHLGEEDYELEDIMKVPEYSVKVIFRLFLCSSDYSVEIITFEEDKED